MQTDLCCPLIFMRQISFSNLIISHVVAVAAVVVVAVAAVVVVVAVAAVVVVAVVTFLLFFSQYGNRG